MSLTTELRDARRSGREQKALSGLNLALIFREDIDAYPQRLRGRGSPAGRARHADGRKLIAVGTQGVPADTARVLSRLFDGIEYRGLHQSTVETIAAYSSVPVWNGLTDEWHPTQSLCDMFTMRESSGLDDPRHRVAGSSEMPASTSAARC